MLASTTVTATADITARPLTVTADGKSKVYGDAEPALTYQITSGSLAFSDAFSGALTRAPGETVAGSPYAISQGTLTAGGNYSISYVGAELTITKADATINVSGYTRVYDGNAYGATGTATGVKGETLSGLDLGATFTDVPGGSAHWTFTDVTGNYNDDAGDVAIAISRADATINVGGYTGIYDGEAHGATGTATGVKGKTLSGLDLGATFTDVPGGTAHWTFDAGGNYNTASGDAAIVITKANQTINWTNPPSIVYGTPLGAVQLNATVTVVGLAPAALAYSPPAGTILDGGSHQALSVTAAATQDYNEAMKTVYIDVIMAPGSIYVLDPTVSGALTLSGNASLNIGGNLFVDSNSSSAAFRPAEMPRSRPPPCRWWVVSARAEMRSSPRPARQERRGIRSAYLIAPHRQRRNVRERSAAIQRRPSTPASTARSRSRATAALTLNPGVYIITGGGLSVTGNGSITGNGVTIYNGGSGSTYGGIALSGNGRFKLSAPTSGDYKGILIFQARDNTRAMSISGNATHGHQRHHLCSGCAVGYEWQRPTPNPSYAGGGPAPGQRQRVQRAGHRRGRDRHGDHCRRVAGRRPVPVCR